MDSILCWEKCPVAEVLWCGSTTAVFLCSSSEKTQQLRNLF